MKRTLLKLIILSVFHVLVGRSIAEQPVSLFEQFNRIRSNEEAVVAFICSLSKQQVFDLCNQYGAAVDGGVEGNEGMLIEVALMEVKQKEGISSSDLLTCAGVDTASVHWRRLALRYASGTGSFVEKQQIDSESALRSYSGIITNTAVAPVLRGEACEASARVLVDGYFMAACGTMDRDKSHRALIRTADTGPCRTQDRKAAAFIDLVLTLAQEESTPEDVRGNSIPKALRMIIHERGLKTPRFDQVQRLSERESERSSESRRLPYEKLLREVRVAAAEVEKEPK